MAQAESTGQVGLGSYIELGDGASPEQFAEIANVVSIDGPGETMEIVNSTHLRSPGGYREKRPHLKDGGTISMTVHFDPNHPTHDSETGVRKKYLDKIKCSFRLHYNGFSQFDAFKGFVTNVGRSIAVDNMIEMSLEVTITGPVTEETP